VQCIGYTRCGVGIVVDCLVVAYLKMTLLFLSIRDFVVLLKICGGRKLR